MVHKKKETLSRDIIAQAIDVGADLAGIAAVEDLKRSPSHRFSEIMPAFDGVGTQYVAGRKRGMVQWQESSRSAIVIAIAHPREKTRTGLVGHGGARGQYGRKPIAHVGRNEAGCLARHPSGYPEYPAAVSY
jgi:hypothetical protein